MAPHINTRNEKTKIFKENTIMLKKVEEKRGGGTNPEMSSAHPETQLNPKVESSIKPSEKNTSDLFIS